jgi:hypothetical protein
LASYFFGQDEDYEDYDEQNEKDKNQQQLLKPSRTLPEISNYIKETNNSQQQQQQANNLKSSLGNLIKETKSYILDYVIDTNHSTSTTTTTTTDSPAFKTKPIQKLTIQEARKRGILNVEKGLYVNSNNKNTTMPIDEAIRLGLIGARVTICEKNFINDANASDTSMPACNGGGGGGDDDGDDIIDANIEACTSTLTIDSVFDPKSSHYVSISEALKLGLLNQTNLSYKHCVSGEVMTLNEAFSKGFVRGNQFYENNNQRNVNAASPSSSSNTTTDTTNSSCILELDDEEKCFQIKSFLNPLTKTHVSLEQAIHQGLFNKEKGLFINPLNGKSMNLNEALKSGFMQALTNERGHSSENKNILVIDVVNNKTLNPDKTLLYQVNEVEEFKFMVNKDKDSFQSRSLNLDDQRVEEIIEDDDDEFCLGEEEEANELGKPPISMRKNLPKSKQTNLKPNIVERRIRESVCNSLDIGARETLIIDDVRQSMALDIDGVTHVVKNEFVIDCDYNGDAKIGKCNEMSSSLSSLSSSPSKNSVASSTSESSSHLKAKTGNNRTVIVVDDQLISYAGKNGKKKNAASKSEDGSNTLKIDVNKNSTSLQSSQFLSNSERALYERVNKSSKVSWFENFFYNF